HRRELRPGGQQLHRQADRVRQVRRHGAGARALLAAAQRAAADVPGDRLVTTPLDLLLIEDSETDAELIGIELRRHGYDGHARRVATEPALREALATGSWDLALSDHNLPGFASSEAQRIVNESSADIPFVMLSGTIGEEATVEALRSGARDVVLKSNLSRI